MRISVAIVFVIGAAVIALGVSLIMRDGLLAIAHEIRDKPMPTLPDTVNIRAITVEHATMTPGPGSSPSGDAAIPGGVNLKVTIENMRLESWLPDILKPGTQEKSDKPKD